MTKDEQEKIEQPEEVQTEKNSKLKEVEKQNKELLEKVKTLESKVFDLEIENRKNINDFQQKALSFQTKAQEEINKHKELVNEKLETEKAHTKKYGYQKMVEAIIDPLINLNIAIKYGSTQENISAAAYVKGFEMLMNQLDSELESLGITKIIPKVGDEFLPELHYAISLDEGFEKNKIKEVKKVGYKLHDRVIKTAVVIVGA